MSGLTSSWHDLVLHLIARHLGPTVTHAMAKFMLLQWHAEGQPPYVTFSPPTGHGDAVISRLPEWLRVHFAEASPVDEMVRRCGLPERSLKRRFARATGYSPITYVKFLRIEEAKHQLERSDIPADEISWQVG